MLKQNVLIKVIYSKAYTYIEIDIILVHHVQGGHMNNDNNCYSSAVLSCLHSMPEIWKLLQNLSELKVIMADLLLHVMLATQSYHNSSSLNVQYIYLSCVPC